MKTIKYTFIAMLAAASMAAFSPAAMGQNTDSKDKPARTEGAARGPRQGQRMTIEKQVEQMTKDLGLSKEQGEKMTVILKEQQEKMTKLRTDGAKREEINAARKEFTEKIEKVLTKEQIEKRKELAKERAARGGNRPNRAPAQ